MEPSEMSSARSLLLLTSDSVKTATGVTRTSKPNRVISVAEIFTRFPSRGEHVLVEELAVAARVSQRTLWTAFNDYFGVGPVRYLQLRKLNQVHRALKAADPEADLVSDILMAHGEWQFSRFASRYRRLFGELPSETLRRKPR